ncbi:MAG TPA: pyridoxamine 5'-phosphate oxidase family protein [Ktedonobacteraceae bacterium]|nr:pyridoxamine 5'-phosphate oxidase family protein [Ktedonobacteraceae bacterium]
MRDQWLETARDILENNLYMCLATVDGTRPWVSPVYFSFDEYFTFYFVSESTSHHVRFLLANPEAALVIYDSRQPPFTGDGVWVEGQAFPVLEEELPIVLENYCNRPHPANIERGSEGLSPADFLSKTHLKWFKVIPRHIYVRDAAIFDRDRRREVPLP